MYESGFPNQLTKRCQGAGRCQSAVPVGEGVDSQVESESCDEEHVQAVQEEGKLGPAFVS